MADNDKSIEMLRAKVAEGRQVVLVALFVTNPANDNGALFESQLEAVEAMSKNVLELAGCEVESAATAVRIGSTDDDATAILSATLTTERN